ncbi:MAG: hypothetical protein JSS07_11325 [Proteobacteria bacterium]|nr:hypothetical protein [Pseudomonadota bacterium]
MKLKRILALLIITMSANLHADEVSDECLQSMQHVYKFYYHEIFPKSDEAPEQLGTEKTSEMQTIIGKLKTTCSPELIAKMNQYLQADEKGQG